MFLPGLAWKNLSRYRKRTVITASALAFGLATYIFMDGWLKGAETESERNLVRYETGSSRVLTREYWAERDRMPLASAIENPEPVIAALREAGIPAVPRTLFAGEAVVEEGSMPVRVIAIDADRDEQVFSFRETVTEGRYLEAGESGALLGAWLADDLGLAVGDLFTVTTRTRTGFHQTLDLEVVGIVDCPNPAINKGTLFVPLDTADTLMEMGGAVTEIDLKYRDYRTAEKTNAKLATGTLASFPGLTVVSWRDLSADYLAVSATKKGGSNVMLLLVFIIAAVGVSNTMLMTIFERIRELGMMRALGMRDRDIRRVFLLEAGGIGLIGSVAGVGLGCIANYAMVRWGIDFSAFVDMSSMDIGYRISSVMHAAWNPPVIVVALLAGVLACVAVAVLPVRRALKLTITDCLRHT
ncbi:MAG: FtsX-like permease family protein [Spirochaetes bacterium]|nr:FtsX-like permease family protein [Spirochaetota bacterium]